MRSIQALALAVVFVSGGALNLKAQDGAEAARNSDTARNLVDRCARWTRAEGPQLVGFDPVEFCAGLKNPAADGWYSLKCGDAAARAGGTAPGYCDFVGHVTPRDTLAVSIRTASTDGHELLASKSDPATEDPANAPTRTSASFYSRTAFSMGGLRLDRGLYRLLPFQSGDGWKMAVARMEDESSVGDRNNANKRPQLVGTVEMRTIALGQDTLIERPSHSLVAQIYLMPQHCPGPKSGVDMRELEFGFDSTDISVCIRTDKVPPIPQENLSQR